MYKLFDRREFDITTDEEERFEYNGDAEENESDTESKLSSHNNSLLSPLGCVSILYILFAFPIHSFILCTSDCSPAVLTRSHEIMM